jgi:hypothetical protein
MSDKIKKFHDALDDVLDRPIAYNPAFRRITGSTVAGIFLSQAWYWSKRHKDDDGWFYHTGTEWEEETGLTRSEQETARKHCLRVGVTEEKLKGIPATMYYRVVKSQVYTLLGLEFVDIPQTGQIEGNQQSDGYSNINKVSETPTAIPPSVGLSEKELSQANAQVTAMIENAKKAKYENRDKIPDALLPFSDVYVEVTGQKPSKRVLMDWIATFSDWVSEGLQPKDIRAAYQHATRPDGGFLVGRPGSLTNTAVALKSKSQVFAPAIDESAIEATKRLIEQKSSGTFAPPPPIRPAIVMKSLADRKGLRK